MKRKHIEKYYILNKETLYYEYVTDSQKIKSNKIFIHQLYLLIIFFIFFGAYIDFRDMKLVNNELTENNIELQNQLDELEIECNYENIVKVKAGEYAMHSHSIKNKISDTAVVNLLQELNAWYPEIKMAQIQMEFGVGTSDLAHKANNIVGMKITQKRETTQLKNKEYNDYGVYNNWESCVIDLVLWDYAMFKGHKPSLEEYINTLNNFYGGYGDYGTKRNYESHNYKHYFKN